MFWANALYGAWPMDPLAALGIMSSVGSSGQANAEQYASRRAHARESLQLFASATSSIQVRFILARPPVQPQAIRDEERRHGDMAWLSMNESRFRCALKPLLWYEYCLTAFPTARFFAIADDDAYVQLAHMEADLRSLVTTHSSTRLLMWGLVMWYGAYDNVTMVTHEEWGGWGYADGGAVKTRRRMDNCQASRAASTAVASVAPAPWGHGDQSRNHQTHADTSAPPRRRSRGRGGPAVTSEPCARLSPAALATISRGGLDSTTAPWPVVNGPLFAVSSRLAKLLVVDPLPRRYLDKLHRTERVQTALNRPGGPRKSNFGCWPVGDSILGMWVSQLSERHNESVTLVNTPFMVQHHPWPATVHGAFSNRSIVLHGLKKEKNQRKFRDLVLHRGLGPFVPFRRKCGSCAAMGWSTWPGSVHGQWTCCGCDAAESKRTCDERMGQPQEPSDG